MAKDETTVPPVHSAAEWHVGLTKDGDAEIRIILRSTDEARAWAAWCLDHCGEQL